ncbi:MAG: HAD-IIIA family hydrolase, partial [Candidatus Onthovivens sp.]|nr:HAD-IIIA family hydrolase [Candidatus Onthovivens sp.]
MIAVIMAGGKGTRIASINSLVPKPMIKIFNKPILQYQIETLKNQGIKDFILVVGHLKEQIVDYFKSGESFGVNIEYIEETTPLGTAGSLFYLKNCINEDFLLLNGDTLFNIDINRFYETHKNNNCLVTILTHPNSHPYDSGIIVSDDKGLVLKWYTKEEERTYYKNRVNAGFHMISPKLLSRFNEVKKLDLDRDVLKPLIEEKQLYIYDSSEYILDMGTPERYYQAQNDIENKLIDKKCFVNKQKAIFLDRDGTINKYKGFISNLDDFELLPGVSEAIRKINRSEYLCIVITNQPVIARGEATVEELEEIHNKMETLLGQDGAYINKIFYCPHHPDKGFEGERVEYKIDCSCRKPKPGLVLQAQKDFNIDLENSY